MADQPKTNVSAVTNPISGKSTATNSPLKYPYENAQPRLAKYNFNSQLFIGNHFDAFSIKVQSEQYTKDYAKLRYLVMNFAGLISKVSADMLFSEPPRIYLPYLDDDPDDPGDDTKENEPSSADNAPEDVVDQFSLKAPTANPNQEWLENFLFENRVHAILYESALSNSYKGDAVFKLRIGNIRDKQEKPSVIVEQVQPDYYFPDLDPYNVNAEPKSIEISFITTINGKKYLRKEIHTAGQIENQLFEMNGDEIQSKADLSLLGDPELQDVEQTGVDRLLIVHVPNWTDGTAHFGYDDYQDLISLFYAINNRMAKVDNILDKHSDPILAIPDGIVDEDGNVNRAKFNMFEKGEDGEKPEYIVWNASLEAAFTEIEKVLDSLYMFSEISPAAFGVSTGGGESGRALKYRMMRTVAKIKRKALYYDFALKEIVYLAQLLSTAHDVDALGVTFEGEPEVPSIEWADPIPQDSYEQAQEEELRLASGNQSLKDSIKNIDHLDDEQAIQKIQEIEAEKKELGSSVSVPTGGASPTNPTPDQGGEPDIAVPGQTPAAAAPPQKTDPYASDVVTPKTGKVPGAAV